MTASRPNPEVPTPREDLEGASPGSGDLLDLGDQHLPFVKGGKEKMEREEKSRGYTHKHGLTGKLDPMTPEERRARQAGIQYVKDYLAALEESQKPETPEQREARWRAEAAEQTARVNADWNAFEAAGEDGRLF